MKTLCLAIAITVSGCSGWTVGGITGGTVTGALAVGGGFAAVTAGREHGETYGWVTAGGAIAGGVAGYYLGECARREHDCRVVVILANCLGVGLPLIGAAVFVATFQGNG